MCTQPGTADQKKTADLLAKQKFQMSPVLEQREIVGLWGVFIIA